MSLSPTSPVEGSCRVLRFSTTADGQRFVKWRRQHGFLSRPGSCRDWGFPFRTLPVKSTPHTNTNPRSLCALRALLLSPRQAVYHWRVTLIQKSHAYLLIYSSTSFRLLVRFPPARYRSGMRCDWLVSPCMAQGEGRS